MSSPDLKFNAAAGAEFPQTPTATAALAVATRFYTPALLNHCVRSYLWGTMYGAAHGITYDDELLYVSAMLHDISLTDATGTGQISAYKAVPPGSPAGTQPAIVGLVAIGAGQTATDTFTRAHLIAVAPPRAVAAKPGTPRP